MRYALADGSLAEAVPKLKATCQCCSLPVIAKCGRFKIWHWAHKTREHCDQWWEPETIWHRSWKANFPVEWQEIIQEDTVTGERHIADVKTASGLVIEFQHSILKPEELISRENFYEHMVWVVDGCRSDFDATYFKLGLESEPIELHNSIPAFAFNWYGRSKLIQAWCSTKHPVFIDFGEEILWQLVQFNSITKRGTARPVAK